MPAIDEEKIKEEARMLEVWKLVDKWLPLLGLDDWIINIKIEKYTDPEDATCEASIEDDLKYLEANLSIWSPFWKNDNEHREINIVHELVHLLICPLHPHLGPAADEVVESVVQKIAMRYYKIYRSNGK